MVDAPPMKLGRALFEAVGQAPNDLGVHGLVADALTEAGDPRGEHVAMLLKLRASATAPALTEKKLVKRFARHRADWLGPLAALCPKPSGWEPSIGQVDAHFEARSPVWGEHWSLGFPVALVLQVGLEGSTVRAREWLTRA